MRNRAMVPEPLTPGLNSVHLVQLHAGKHDPIAYFEDVRRDRNPWLSWAQMPAFDRSGGLWGDLAGGRVSAFSFIVPTAFCNFDPDDRGTRAGVNPAPIIVGHRTLQKMVNAIQASPREQRHRRGLG